MKLRTTNFKQTLRFAFTGLLALSLLSSCKKDDPYDFKDTIAANVNLINASPDAGTVYLYADDIVRTKTGVSYGQASGYNQTFLGDQDVLIKSSTETTLTSSHAQFDANESYTFLLTGSSSSLGLISLTDDLTAPAAGKAKIRYVNAVPNANTASLNVGDAVLVAAQGFKGVAPSFEVAAGSYSLSAVSSGTRSAVSAVTLQSGKIYTIYATGLVGGTGNSAFSLGVFANK